MKALRNLIRHPSLIVNALRHRSEFRLGWAEAFGDGRTFNDDPWSAQSLAYDSGRDLKRRGQA